MEPKSMACYLVTFLLCIQYANGLSELPRVFDDSLNVYDFDLNILNQTSQRIVIADPGESIIGTIEFQRWSGSNNPGEISQVFLLYSWSHLPPRSGEYTPLYDGVPGIYPGVSKSELFVIDAPAEPGTYYIWAHHKACYSMGDAIREIKVFPEDADAIGIVLVKDDSTNIKL